MSEHDFERLLGEWMAQEPDAPAPWILPSVVSHARRHPKRTWQHRLAAWLPASLGGPGSTSPRRRLAFALAVVALVSILVVPFVWRTAVPSPDEAPAVMPASPLPRPDEAMDIATGGGLVGSVWQEVADSGTDGIAASLTEDFITLHPDGTLVRVGVGPGSPVGIGVWRPTGDISLTSVVVYPDADPLFHLTPGHTTYRAEWAFDIEREEWSRSWSATIEPADGSSISHASGTSTLTQLVRSALPADADYPVPPEPAWALNYGPMIPTVVPGKMLSMMCLGQGHEAPWPGDPPDYLVTHGDGTAFIISRVTGPGAGLWIGTGPDVVALTAWSDHDHLGASNNAALEPEWVAQLSGAGQVQMQAGGQDMFRNACDASTSTIEPLDEPLPPVDPDLWPTSGSVWLEPTASGPIISAYLTDGTVIIRHPELGTGAGYWQPTGEHTIAASVGFSTLRGQDHRRWLEGTIDPDDDVMSITYRQQDQAGGPVETGEASATRLRIDD